MEIKGLYKIKKKEQEQFLETVWDVFQSFPKKEFFDMKAETVQAAQKAAVWYFVNYEMKYGSAFSSDETIRDSVCVIHSDEMNATQERYRAAGSYGPEFEKAMAKLTGGQKKYWWDLFEEFDRQEANLDLPYPHLYLDYLGVREAWRRQGRGRRMVQAVCDYASSVKLPIVLFTNTEEDIRFYESLGFRELDIISSEEFDFFYTYMVKDA